MVSIPDFLDNSSLDSPMDLAYQTDLGKMYIAKVEDALKSEEFQLIKGKVDLIFTSPPFPLRRKKKYGNKTGEEYLTWLAELAPQLVELLSPTGSIVLEIGNAWEAGEPLMSTLPLEALLEFKRSGNLLVCQQFISHNPSRLPGPAQWVNIERIRVKDSFNYVWWMSKTSRPKASNRNILTEYSKDMQQLLKSQSYNSGKRPSGHYIGTKSFLTDHGGAIPSNVLEVSNSNYAKDYIDYCKSIGVEPHPARMQEKVVEFFIKMLTDENDLVYDPFAGSNTTGSVAQKLGRKWISTEPVQDYVMGSQVRFNSLETFESKEWNS